MDNSIDPEQLPERVERIHDISVLRGYLLNKDILPDEFVEAMIHILDYAEKKTNEEVPDYFQKF